MTPRQVIAFIRYHGVVLQSAKGLEPSMTVRIAGGPIRGSWWGHPMGHEIFALLQKIDKSTAVLTCPLAGGRVTYLHRRLWPPFVRLSRQFPEHALDRIQQVHLPSGRHERRDIPFPEWVPKSVLTSAQRLTKPGATAEIQIWLTRYGATR